jgi:hypothetical protein
MELHTLGVHSGYTQADVTEYSRALTGWTIGDFGPGQIDDANPDDFDFRPQLHEPGPRTVMGKRYNEEGEAQAAAILTDFASSPHTADHISEKLACHFARDTPPPALVARLSDSFCKSGGDLPAVYRTLIWLNRLVSLMPHEKDEAIALAPTVPMALRGSMPVSSYAPSSLPDAADDLMTRVGMLYDKDPQLHPLDRGPAGERTSRRRERQAGSAGLGTLAAKFLSRDDGARIAMIETAGWDTHAAQAPRLAAQLKALDTTIAAMRDTMGQRGRKRPSSSPQSSAARRRSTAPAAPITVLLQWQCCSAAP